MPHQCIRCNKLYEDGATEILKGCSCGARLFFFIKKEKLEQSRKEIQLTLNEVDKLRVEQDVLTMIGAQEQTTPVVLDFESVRVLKPGKYELDLVHLFKGDPLIFKLADGKYIIDVASTFQANKKK
ncbi:hypothetical protein HY485_01905 [Candidatus Woesearchaeota archaeon]|nr:hypothetical protein [Candidatus Woesearchaeota archaeon]